MRQITLSSPHVIGIRNKQPLSTTSSITVRVSQSFRLLYFANLPTPPQTGVAFFSYNLLIGAEHEEQRFCASWRVKPAQLDDESVIGSPDVEEGQRFFFGWSHSSAKPPIVSPIFPSPLTFCMSCVDLLVFTQAPDVQLCDHDGDTHTFTPIPLKARHQLWFAPIVDGPGLSFRITWPGVFSGVEFALPNMYYNFEGKEVRSSIFHRVLPLD